MKKMLKIEYDKERIERNIETRKGYIETNPHKRREIESKLEILERRRFYLIEIMLDDTKRGEIPVTTITEN